MSNKAVIDAPPIPTHYLNVRTTNPKLRFALITTFFFYIIFLAVSIGMLAENYTVFINPGEIYKVVNGTPVAESNYTLVVSPPGLLLSAICIGFVLLAVNTCIYNTGVNNFYIHLPYPIPPSKSFVRQNAGALFTCLRNGISFDYYSIYSGSNLPALAVIGLSYSLIEFLIFFNLSVLCGIRNLSTIFMISGVMVLVHLVNRNVAPTRLSYVVMRNFMVVFVYTAVWYVLLYSAVWAPQSGIKQQTASFVLSIYTLKDILTPWFRWERLRRVTQYADFAEMEMFLYAKLGSVAENEGKTLPEVADAYKSELSTRNVDIIADYKLLSGSEIKTASQQAKFYRFSETGSALCFSTGCDELFNFCCCLNKKRVLTDITTYRKNLLEELDFARGDLKGANKANTDPDEIERRGQFTVGGTMVNMQADSLTEMPEVLKNVFVLRILQTWGFVESFVIDVWSAAIIAIFIIPAIAVAISSVTLE